MCQIVKKKLKNSSDSRVLELSRVPPTLKNNCNILGKLKIALLSNIFFSHKGYRNRNSKIDIETEIQK